MYRISVLRRNITLLGVVLNAGSIDVNNLRLIEFLLIEASDEEVIQSAGYHLDLDQVHEAVNGTASLVSHSHRAISLFNLVNVVSKELVCSYSCEAVVSEDNVQEAENTLEIFRSAFGVIGCEVISESSQHSSENQAQKID